VAFYWKVNKSSTSPFPHSHVPNNHSHLPLPFGRWHRSGLHRGEASLFRARFPRLICPLLTPVTRWAPLAGRSLVVSACCRVRLVCIPNLSVRLARAMTRYCLTPGFCLTGFPLYSGSYQLQLRTRRNGPPGVNTCLSAHERRVYLPGLRNNRVRS